MDRPLLVKILLVAAVVFLGVALCLTAGWFFDSGNASAWGYAGLLAFVTSVLVEKL